MVLSNSCIAQAVEEVSAFFESTGISKKDQIRLRLLIENALITLSSSMAVTSQKCVALQTAETLENLLPYI